MRRLRALRRAGKLFVISSPSGGGKTTALSHLLRRAPRLVPSISVTTRPPRRSERQGRHYRFISKEAFALLKRRGELLEWARVHTAHYYGTPKAPVLRALRAGRDVALCIDVQGARQIRRRFGRTAVLIFLLPPSFNDLRARLMKRRTETLDDVQQRLETARRELACVAWYDYAVVNDRLDDAVRRLHAIVEAERCRVDSGGGNRRATVQRGGRVDPVGQGGSGRWRRSQWRSS